MLAELGAQVCETPACLWGLQPAHRERRVGEWGGQAVLWRGLTACSDRRDVVREGHGGRQGPAYGEEAEGGVPPLRWMSWTVAT